MMEILRQNWLFSGDADGMEGNSGNMELVWREILMVWKRDDADMKTELVVWRRC
jgi:hypothetical protein